MVTRSIKLMLEYLRNDPNVFRVFKPNKPLLRKMDVSVHIMSQASSESELALEFCGFLMRYHRAVDFGDFSDSPFVVQRLRRFQEFKSWAEIDDLQSLTETFMSRFDQFKQSNHSAFQELLTYMDKITKEFTH